MKILYLIATPRITGGTPKKTLDMIKHSQNDCVVYFWSDAYRDKQELFRRAGATIYTGAYGRNLFRHVISIIRIIDEHDIDIVMTQFSFGELLGCCVKLIKPKVKLVVAFVGALHLPFTKKIILNALYRRVDAFIYISEYVKREKLSAFPVLRNRPGKVIYNGTSPLPSSTGPVWPVDSFKILSVSYLVDFKNIATLVRAIGFIMQRQEYNNIELTVLGDGPERSNLESLIKQLKIENQVKLMGYREDVGDFLYQSNCFAHPCIAEGFGIAVAEAMMAGVPVIAANAGALPELIVNCESGLLVESLDAQKWAEAIIKLISNPSLAKQLGNNGKHRAENLFSVERFVANYDKFYKEIINGK